MEFSRKERLILCNQCLILEKLYPEEAEGYAQTRKALERGWALHYSDLAENIFEDELSEQECQEVLDILNMYSFLNSVYKKLKDTEGIDEQRIKFDGFDGNSETSRMAYVRYFIKDLGRFQELDSGGDFNSHIQRLHRYQKMLREWHLSPDKFELTKDDIIRITSAR